MLVVRKRNIAEILKGKKKQGSVRRGRKSTFGVRHWVEERASPRHPESPSVFAATNRLSPVRVTYSVCVFSGHTHTHKSKQSLPKTGGGLCIWKNATQPTGKCPKG